ncbi:MAG: RlmE family RNA methyltransferase [Myxococcota bacterium]|nr:RlmE family RNA methyltransferase [Myxococcota bacterium]
MARYERRDHFHQRAKREGVRSRAFYKLEELQRAHRLMRRGDRVIDLGCWPGGWLQCAAAVVGSRGRVVGVDLATIEPALGEANAVALVGDLADRTLAVRLREVLAASRCDVLLSDAAPKLTGIRDADRAREERLLEAIEALLPELLREGGNLLLKILEGPEARAIDRRMRSRFERAKSVRTQVTRKGSSERYLLGCGFQG